MDRVSLQMAPHTLNITPVLAKSISSAFSQTTRNTPPFYLMIGSDVFTDVFWSSMSSVSSTGPYLPGMVPFRHISIATMIRHKTLTSAHDRKFGDGFGLHQRKRFKNSSIVPPPGIMIKHSCTLSAMFCGKMIRLPPVRSYYNVAQRQFNITPYRFAACSKPPAPHNAGPAAGHGSKTGFAIRRQIPHSDKT